jgi:HEAT repeat-containing protein 5
MSTHHGLMDCTTASQRVADAATRQNARNDEGESLNSGLSQESKADDHGRLTSRRTQLFAFECLHDICTVVVAERTSKLHCGSKSGHSSLWTLFLGYGLCYWNSFGASCSTSRCDRGVHHPYHFFCDLHIRISIGICYISSLLRCIWSTSLHWVFKLEDHQAPITELTFSFDSTPEILAFSVHACAVFVGCGVVKDVGRMGRIINCLLPLWNIRKVWLLHLVFFFFLKKKRVFILIMLPITLWSAMLRILTLSPWAQLQV